MDCTHLSRIFTALWNIWGSWDSPTSSVKKGGQSGIYILELCLCIVPGSRPEELLESWGIALVLDDMPDLFKSCIKAGVGPLQSSTFWLCLKFSLRSRTVKVLLGKWDNPIILCRVALNHCKCSPLFIEQVLENDGGVDAPILVVVQPLRHDGSHVLELGVRDGGVSKDGDTKDLGVLVPCNRRRQLWEDDRLARGFARSWSLGCRRWFLCGCSWSIGACGSRAIVT